ncbi:MAG: flagellar hook-length control protein FliK [Dongiaceae bacterium]
MSMEPIRFDPAIGPDLQIDRHRQNAGQSPAQDMFADLLGDQLKRRAEAERQELGAARRELLAHRRQASDPLSGRGAGIVLAHARTLRGEAKQIDEPAERRLPDRSRRSLEDGCERTSWKETVCTKPAAGEESTADQSAETADDKEQTSDPLVTVAISVQPPIDTAGNRAEAAGDLTAPAPEANDDKATSGTGDADPATASADPGQQAVAATLDAGLSTVVAMLDTGGTTAPTGKEIPQQPPSLSAAALPGQQPVANLPETEINFVDLTPRPAQPQRPAADLKPRPGLAARTNAGEPAPSANSTNDPRMPINPHLVPGVQAGRGAELGAGGEFSDASLPGDSPGPGWALHLAQGSAGKRAEFLAQLKQHLQNLPAQEQVAVHIQRALRQGTGKFSIQLSPAELGRIQVKLEIDEEKRVTAAVTVERPSTLELLQRDVKGLERALHDAGLKMDGGDLSFSLGRGRDQEFAQDLDSFDAAGLGGDRAERLAEGDRPDVQPGEVLDIAAGMVNLQI